MSLGAGERYASLCVSTLLLIQTGFRDRSDKALFAALATIPRLEEVDLSENYVESIPDVGADQRAL
jgi:hypothetical protein